MHLRPTPALAHTLRGQVLSAQSRFDAARTFEYLHHPLSRVMMLLSVRRPSGRAAAATPRGVAPRGRPLCLHRTAPSAASSSASSTVKCMQEQGDGVDWQTKIKAAAAAALAAAVLLVPQPVLADGMIETVSPEAMTKMAKPLPKQQVDKGKVWLIFIGGAASLFATTVLLETNSSFFPAISKANQAMMQSREKKQKQASPPPTDTITTMTASAAAPPRPLPPPPPLPAGVAPDAELQEIERQAKLVEEALREASREQVKPPSVPSPLQQAAAGGTAVAQSPAAEVAAADSPAPAPPAATTTGTSGGAGGYTVVSDIGAASAVQWPIAGGNDSASSSSTMSFDTSSVSGLNSAPSQTSAKLQAATELLANSRLQSRGAFGGSNPSGSGGMSSSSPLNSWLPPR